MAKGRHKKPKGNAAAPPAQLPALPPPDNPLRRSMEFDPDREYKSREMAEKRLEAIRKTREMPTAAEESLAINTENAHEGESEKT
jgi:hypothetical protein